MRILFAFLFLFCQLLAAFAHTNPPIPITLTADTFRLLSGTFWTADVADASQCKSFTEKIPDLGAVLSFYPDGYAEFFDATASMNCGGYYVESNRGVETRHNMPQILKLSCPDPRFEFSQSGYIANPKYGPYYAWSQITCVCRYRQVWDGSVCKSPIEEAKIVFQNSTTASLFPAKTGGTESSPFAIQVTQGGRPKAGVSVSFSVDVTPNSGGHDHHDASRPKGTLSITQATTDASGEIKFIFKAPEIAGIHTVKATCATCSNSPAVKEVQVRVPGLVEMPTDSKSPPSYTLVGQNGNHGSNHWFLPKSRDTLFTVADAMFATGWGTVGVNDGSLIWGGLFDIKGAWTPSHSEHRTGDEVDLSVKNPRNITDSQKKKTYAEFCKKENTAFSIQTLWHVEDGYPEHFHMYLNGSGLTREAKGGPCCARYKTSRVKKDKNGDPVLDKNGNPVQEIVALCEETTPR